MKIKLGKPFAANSAVDEYDVRQIKKTLNRLGYYQPYGKTGITGIPDAAVFAALKAFQKDQGLPPTGSANPDDETVRLLNRASAAKKSGQYVWRTAGDDKVRPSHAELEGRVRDFSDSPDPGEEFNCRCWAEPVSDSDIEKEELPPSKKEQPTIPGTNIPDRGIPEQGYPGSPKYDPYNDDGRDRAIPLRPYQPPQPNIDPGMEIPYNPNDPRFSDPYGDV